MRKKRKTEVSNIRRSTHLAVITEYKKLKFNYTIVAIAFYILALLTIYLIFLEITTLRENIKFREMSVREIIDEDYQISFDNLTEDEVNRTLEDLDQIYPELLVGHKGITFTKNLSKFMTEEELSDRTNTETLGFNRGGDVYVLYLKDRCQLRLVLEHEILHTFFINTDETHKIIHRLDDYEIIYQKKVCGRLRL